MADVPLGAILCLGWEWEQHAVRQQMQEGRSEMLLSMRYPSPVISPHQGYLMLLKLGKHRNGTFPNLKRQQRLIINASFNRAANEARDYVCVVGVSSGMANPAPAWSCSSSEVRDSHSRVQFQGWIPS